MSLKMWLENGWLVTHQTTRRQVGDLLTMVHRDLHVATGTADLDWSFGIAYNAALKLCTILLFASGYRAGRDLNHYRTLTSLPLILGPDRAPDAAYLDQCRMKRNDVTLVGFGTFKVAKRAARVGVNPQTKEKMKIPARKIVKFKPGTEFDHRMAGGLDGAGWSGVYHGSRGGLLVTDSRQGH